MTLRRFAPLFLAAIAFGQKAAPPKPAVLEGKVFNAVTNEPLRKTELVLSTALVDDEDFGAAMAMFSINGNDTPPAPPAETTPKVEKKTFKTITDAAGKFRFENVDPGDYYLTATHAGFVDEHYKPGTHIGADGQLRLAGGDEVTGVALRMTPQGAVSGRVLDEDGDPMPNALVTAMSFNYATGRRKLMPVDTTNTNDRGEYRLGKLPPGHYYISASALHIDPMGAAAPAPKDGSPETGYVTSYYPATVDVSQASKVDVTPAADITGIMIRLQKSKVTRVKGQALTAEGTPMKGGQVMLMNTSNMGSMQMSMMNAEGRFELANVQPGPYTLMIVQMTGGKPSITMQPVTVPADGLADLKLGSQTEKTISGKVVMEGDGKIPPGLNAMLAGDDGSPTMPAFGSVSESGTFTLKVSPAEYALRLTPIPRGTYLKSVKLNGRDVLGKPLDLSGGAGDLVVTLAADGGQVDSAVSLRDKPVFDATVVLLPVDPNRRFEETVRQGSTDEAGRVSIKDVPPGEYLLFAWEKVEPGEWFDPDAIKAVDKQGVRVSVGAKRTESVQVKAIPRI